MILAEKILMVEPRGFSFNQETSSDNFFQSPGNIKAPVETALKEFYDLKNKLVKAGIEVVLITPDADPITPDSIFPNNWFSTNPSGKLFIYPLKAKNRRLERKKEIIDKLKKTYSTITDLSHLEDSGLFLEGTGSLVIDHENKIAYASLSHRTSLDAAKEWGKLSGYEILTFTSKDENDHLIYHTNVMLSLGDKFSIVCLECIANEKERESLKNKLSAKNELIIISLEQVKAFCGNVLVLKNHRNEIFIVMSTKAFQAFTESQKYRLIRYGTIIHSPLATIETIGGGSARCMIAELF
jgi:hypothetical protein